MHTIHTISHHRFWRTYGLVLARILMAGLFFMACYFKFKGMEGTALAISQLHFPFPLFFAWVAAFFELFLAVAFLTGFLFREAAILAGVYIVFLAFAFHGPALWMSSQTEFGFFVDHFTMLAGLLFMAAHGPGETLVVKRA